MKGNSGTLTEPITVTPPEMIKAFFEDKATLNALGYTGSEVSRERLRWVWLAQDTSYQDSINNKMPVYAQVESDTKKAKCSKVHIHKCLATIVSSAHGMITRSDGISVLQFGDPAIGMFNPFFSFPLCAHHVAHLYIKFFSTTGSLSLVVLRQQRKT